MTSFELSFLMIIFFIIFHKNFIDLKSRINIFLVMNDKKKGLSRPFKLYMRIGKNNIVMQKRPITHQKDIRNGECAF